MKAQRNAVAKKPAMKAKAKAVLKKHKAGTAVKTLTWAKRLALRPKGCSKCRWKPGCTPSCFKK